MSRVLVDRVLAAKIAGALVLEDAYKDWGEELRAILAQPAEAEGVINARLMNTLAELARRAPLRTLHTICETQRQVSTVKLERYLGPVGDTLAGYAFTLRNDFDKLSAALSAVTAERDRVLAERECKVLVPTEPTEAMLTAYSTNPNHVASAGAIYRAMLSAAMAAKEEDKI